MKHYRTLPPLGLFLGAKLVSFREGTSKNFSTGLPVEPWKPTKTSSIAEDASTLEIIIWVFMSPACRLDGAIDWILLSFFFCEGGASGRRSDVKSPTFKV